MAKSTPAFASPLRPGATPWISEMERAIRANERDMEAEKEDWEAHQQAVQAQQAKIKAQMQALHASSELATEKAKARALAMSAQSLRTPQLRDLFLAKGLGASAADYLRVAASAQTPFETLCAHAQRAGRWAPEIAGLLAWSCEGVPLPPQAPDQLWVGLLLPGGLAALRAPLASGVSLPESILIRRAPGGPEVRMSPLHALCLYSTPKEEMAAVGLFLCERFDPEARDSEGYTVLGRINQELPRCSDRANALALFLALASAGARAQDLAPEPWRLAADPAIVRLASAHHERQGLDEAMGAAPAEAKERGRL